MNLETLDFSLESLRSAYAGGVSVRSVWAEFCRRLEAWADPSLMIAAAREEHVEAILRRLESVGANSLPLYGTLFAIKDNIDWDALQTTAACREFAYAPKRSAFVVQALIDAGAIPVGKTNLDQFATGLVGVRSPYGIPRNAIDPKWIPGGSSSGSASIVAAGLVTFSLGTDTAGSGRVPAAFQNIVGYKPTKGFVSTTGVVPACQSLDCVSIFAQTAEETSAVAQVAVAFDGEDPYARVRFESKSSLARRPTVGIVPESQRQFFGDAEFDQAYREAVVRLEKMGCDVVSVDFTPFFETAALLYQGPWVAERLCACRELWKDNPDAFYPVTRTILQTAAGKSALDAFDAFHRLEELRSLVKPLWNSIDFVMTPTAATLPTVDQVLADPIEINSRLGTYTNFMNLLDLAAIAVPSGFVPGGRPFGVTFFSLAGSDSALFSWAQVWQKAVQSPHPSYGRTAIAVAGAHLSAMPLNGQLLERGARLICETKTSSRYKLYAFQDGPIAKPGLVRSTEGGASIDLEVWDMDERTWGSFVQAIPYPLGIGKIELEDGAWVSGFVMDARYAEECQDITSFGGWRAYVKAKSASK